MKKALKETREQSSRLVLILDESSSMMPLRDQTVDGFNSMVRKQKETGGACSVSAIAFSDTIRPILEDVPLHSVRPLKTRHYRPHGCTALYDAVGSQISRIMSMEEEADRPDTTIFVIMTDGMENASRQYTAAQVRQLIKKAKCELDWQFLFLGANIDVGQTAEELGIEPEYAAEYIADREGTSVTYDAMSEALCSLRENTCPYAAIERIRRDTRTRRH